MTESNKPRKPLAYHFDPNRPLIPTLESEKPIENLSLLEVDVVKIFEAQLKDTMREMFDGRAPTTYEMRDAIVRVSQMLTEPPEFKVLVEKGDTPLGVTLRIIEMYG